MCGGGGSSWICCLSPIFDLLHGWRCCPTYLFLTLRPFPSCAVSPLLCLPPFPVHHLQCANMMRPGGLREELTSSSRLTIGNRRDTNG